MALLVWSAMFPFSTAISYVLAQLSFLDHRPLVMRTFCLTCLVVPYMVFGVFPILNQHFRAWLHGDNQRAETTSGDSVRSDTTPAR
jgi:antibiotic biosynthesis monooxygenase (ABM) superfamily enzyme